MRSPCRSCAPFLVGLSLLAGCRNLERFDTNGEAAYCGTLVGAPFAHEGFVPDGSPPALRLRLELDVDQLQNIPGTLNSDDAGSGICGDAPLFQNARLRAIEEMAHDPLSTLNFLEASDYDFFAWVDSTCAGTLVGVVSLMKNDEVQLRLLKPASEANAQANAAARPGFALFRLSRRTDGCNF